jgi:pSer/pThr/pTyr-binding forkhead associated (FHA) protein
MNPKKNRRSDISITFMSGPLDGKIMTFEQPEKGKQRIINVGRREGCDIHLPFDNQVSRLHARIICSARPVTVSDNTTQPQILVFWLEDAGSRNGVFVEKDPEPISEKTSLRPGTLFKIGRTWLRLDVPLSF